MSIGGRCLCGSVAFEVDGPFTAMGHCHCSMCRKAHGTAYATWLMTATSGLRWLRGSEPGVVARYPSSPGNHRCFCTRCGAQVPDPAASRADSFIHAGLLDGDPGLRPSLHLMVGSRAPWHVITGDLPQHETYPAGWGEPVAYQRPTTPEPGRVRGSCLCGGVRYELAGPVDVPIVSCHCSRCRRAKAAAHGSNLFVAAGRFRWLGGEELVVSFKLPEAERFTQSFCRRCGSKAPRVTPQRVMLPAGTLDDDPGTRAGLHIWASSMAPWDIITDNHPQHAAYPQADFPPVAS